MKTGWKPAHEAYCLTCRRMVDVVVTGFPAPHFRFNLTGLMSSERPVPCLGKTSDPDMTHGMEDPVMTFWPTEPDLVSGPVAEVAASVNSAPGHRFSFVVRSPT